MQKQFFLTTQQLSNIKKCSNSFPLNLLVFSEYSDLHVAQTKHGFAFTKQILEGFAKMRKTEEKRRALWNGSKIRRK